MGFFSARQPGSFMLLGFARDRESKRALVELFWVEGVAHFNDARYTYAITVSCS